jgi:hypothetical protein
MPHLAVRRSRQRGLREAAAAFVAVTGVVAALAMTGPASAAPTTTPGATAAVGADLAVAGVHYARLESSCPPATRGSARCFGVRRVPVTLTPGTVVPQGVEPYLVNSGPAGGYSPANIASLYDYSRTKGGKGQTIAVIDWYDDPKALADLNHFDAYYGFPAETSKTFRKVNQKGKATPLPAASGTSGATNTSGEISMDVQAARAVCAHCTIILVEASAPTEKDLATAEDTAVRLGATEVSNSWGTPENPNAKAKSYRSFAKAFNHPGVVITAPTGNDGWYSWDYADDNKDAAGAPNIPSTLSSVVAVGGTTLTSNGSRKETVWNENGPENSTGIDSGTQNATGGGCSTVFSAARWQSHVAGYGKKRLAADVSAIADPRYGFDVYDSDSDNGAGWFTDGGTSLSSTVIAAMWALAGGSHKVPYPALTLYGNELKHPATLHDITTGGNAFCGGYDPAACASFWSTNYLNPPNGSSYGRLDCSFPAKSTTVLKDNHQCVAAKGYDGPSGVGTPDGLKVFSKLSPKASITASKLRAGKAGKFSAKASDPFPGGKISSYSWSFGDGTHAKGHHPTHTYSAAGTYRVTLKVKDVYGLTHTTHLKLHVK